MPELRVIDHATLVTAIGDWLNRPDLADRISTFIQFAEAMFDRDLRWRRQLVRDVIDECPGADEAYEILPKDFIELKSIRFNTNPPVSPRYLLPRQMELFRQQHTGLTGTPKHYTIIGTMIQFDRTPANLELEIWSYVEVPNLDGTLQKTNVMLEKHPDMYLWGSLIQAESFLKFDERIPLWKGLYEDAKASFLLADKRAERSPGPITSTSDRPAF